MDILKNIQDTLSNKRNNSISKFGNRPTNLTKNNIHLIQNNYTCSIKADGIRCFLYYNNKKIYSILHPFESKEIGKTKNKNTYLLDCEYISELDKYYIFDALISENKNITSLSLVKRLSLIPEDLLSKNILIKDILNLKNNKNIFKLSEKIIKKKYPYKTDGIVYTPIYEKYNSKNIFKWKPLQEQTVDFLIREETSTNSTKKKFSLYVTSINKYVKQNNLKNEKYRKLFPFITQYNSHFPSLFTPSPTVEIDVKLFKQNGITYGNHKNIVIKDNTIVEFSRENNIWIPHKFRLDKTKGYLENFAKGLYDYSRAPNGWRTASNIFRYIQDPIPDNIIFGKKELDKKYYLNIKKKGLNLALYGFNNYVKRYLYTTYLKKSDAILDLAGGRGGDFYKILNKDVNYMLHLDIHNNVLSEAKNRLSKMNKKNTNVNFLQFDLTGNNKNKINKLKKVKHFDVITCQFAFHYMCENKKSIDFITQLIADNLKDNGYFMMTGYDGYKIFELLEDTDFIEFEYQNTVFARIIKKYKKNTFKNYGQKINVYVEKIGLSSDEYLVNYDYIIKRFKKLGLLSVEEKNFTEFITNYNRNLTQKEQEYINLHKCIVFQKKND